MDQIFIAFFGVTAVTLSQIKNKRANKFACIFGMAGQPFWLYMSYSEGLAGVFIVSMLYTISWSVGIKNNFIARQ